MESLDHRLGDQIAVRVGRSAETFEPVGQPAFPDGNMTFDDCAAITEAGSRRFEAFAEESLLHDAVQNRGHGQDPVLAAGALGRHGLIGTRRHLVRAAIRTD